jgi:pyridoxine 4-dehydrogenase
LFVFPNDPFGSGRIIAQARRGYLWGRKETIMTNLDAAGTFTLGHRRVKRLGYGAMQLAGPGVFGPPKDRAAALAVLREAVASGVDHIDTSDFYGPHVTNELIREALHPYPEDLTIVTKVGARRGPEGAWLPAVSREALTQAVHDNLRNLRRDVIDVVNLRKVACHIRFGSVPLERAPLRSVPPAPRRLRGAHF